MKLTKVLSIILALVLSVSAVFVFASCDTGKADGYTANNTEYVIGLSGPLTGGAAMYGEAVANSALMAIEDDTQVVNSVINLLVKARDEGKQIFIIGNGGSGANASHITGDFNKGLSIGQPKEKRYRFISFTDNMATLTSIANDASYNDVFLEQLKNFMNPEDLLIAISGSGNSENVLRAAAYAKECGNTIISFTGFNGGKLKEMSDVRIHIPISTCGEIF